IRSPNARPSRDWLAHARTVRERRKIRQWLRHEEHATSAKLGREILERELKRRRLPKLDDADLEKAAKAVNLNHINHLIASIGQGDLHVGQVLSAIRPDIETSPEHQPRPTAIERLLHRVRGPPKTTPIPGP